MIKNKKTIKGVPMQSAMGLAWLAGMLFITSPVLANPQDAAININFPDTSQPLIVKITKDQSEAHGWKPYEKVSLEVLSAYHGSTARLKDVRGAEEWKLMLNAQAEGEVSILFGEDVFSGPVRIRVNQKDLDEEPLKDVEISQGRNIEKRHEYHFSDGSKIVVHYTDRDLEEYHTDPGLPSSVLDAAVTAYQTITQFEGFNTPGYSFASPDRSYAYDADQTIDIFLGDPSGDNHFEALGWKNRLFRDAPCFDTIRNGSTQYEAVILLPVNYREFIQGWEKINPSSLGKRDLHVDLRGTLIHEMLHVIVFYYNKNLNKADADNRGVSMDMSQPAAKHLDWYVEGLARYFETFAGARHDFYSQGFKQTLPDKIRFSRGGSNYFMRYPDQAFVDLRYENALFWRFIDYRFGMESIEELTRRFRDSNGDFASVLSQVTGTPFEELLKQYAAAVLLNDFGLKEDSMFLHEIAKTRLQIKNAEFYLLNGSSQGKNLGKICRTDWIGQWDSTTVAYGEPSVAGDSTEQSDVSGWATDYVELTTDGMDTKTPDISIRHRGHGKPLLIQTFVFTRGGSMIQESLEPVDRQSQKNLLIQRTIQKNGLQASDVERVVLAITNSDPSVSAEYELVTS